MNVERIRELADVIEALPHVASTAAEGFNMWDYHHPCGSPSCIAGWASFKFGSNADDCLAHDDAEAILGLTSDESCGLFDPVGYGIWSGRMGEITPAHAAAVLRHLAETGEVNWHVGAPITA